MKKFDINKIEAGFVWLQNETEQNGEVPNIDNLICKLDAINSTMAWAGEQMAIAKRILNESKMKEYSQFTKIYGNTKFTPSILKDYINSYCYEAQYWFDVTERFVRTLVHISDNIRTSISALKEQGKLELQSQRVPIHINQPI